MAGTDEGFHVQFVNTPDQVLVLRTHLLLTFRQLYPLCADEPRNRMTIDLAVILDVILSDLGVELSKEFRVRSHRRLGRKCEAEVFCPYEEVVCES